MPSSGGICLRVAECQAMYICLFEQEQNKNTHTLFITRYGYFCLFMKQLATVLESCRVGVG
jgi:hypothetical protein